MRNLISSLISIFTSIIITLLCLLLFFIIGIIIFSKTTDVEIEDTVSYVQSFIISDPDITLTNKNYVNISYTEPNNDNNIINDNSTKSIYYMQLDETSKIIYDALNNNIENLKTGNHIINFNTTFNKLLNTPNGNSILNSSFQNAVDVFFYDYPELFYIDLTKLYLHIKYTTIGSKTTYTVSIAPEKDNSYFHTGFTTENIDRAISNVEYIKNTIVQSVSNIGNDYDKALYVHDTLVNSIEYDTSTTRSNTYNIYGALVENKVVCEGYARAFKYIMDSLNIECILVNGMATNSSGNTESHMWNYIKLNNNWYGIDVTWDDPVVIGGSNKNIIRHTYFCKGSNKFNSSHKVNNKISTNGLTFTLPNLSTINYK